MFGQDNPFIHEHVADFEASVKRRTEAVLKRAGLQFGTFALAGGIDDDELSGGGADGAAVQPYFADVPRVAAWVLPCCRSRPVDAASRRRAAEGGRRRRGRAECPRPWG